MSLVWERENEGEGGRNPLTLIRTTTCQSSTLTLKDEAGNILCFLMSTNPLKKHVLELHCCPKTIHNTSMSHSVALGGVFLDYHEHTHCNLF